jgi:hypothetical protein
MNKYAYVQGDPANFNDPTGMDPNCGPSMYWDGEGCTSSNVLNGVAGSAQAGAPCGSDWMSNANEAGPCQNPCQGTGLVFCEEFMPSPSPAACDVPVTSGTAPPAPDKCHVEIRYSPIVIAGHDTGYDHSMLVMVDDTTGYQQVIDAYPVFGAVTVGTEVVPAVILTADVSTNGHYNNASSSTPYVSTGSTSAICDQWSILVSAAENLSEAYYLFKAGSNSNSLTTYLWGLLGQSAVGPPPGPNSSPGWNGPILYVQ